MRHNAMGRRGITPGKQYELEKERKETTKISSLLCKIISSGDQIQISIKTNIERETRVVVCKMLPCFEVLRHSKQAHESTE